MKSFFEVLAIFGIMFFYILVIVVAETIIDYTGKRVKMEQQKIEIMQKHFDADTSFYNFQRKLYQELNK